MKFSWKNLGTAIGLSGLVSGCSTASLVAHSELTSTDNSIVDSCIWPGNDETVSYLTQRGEIYQVTVYTYAPELADITASINDGTVLVRARYNNMSRQLFNNYTGEHFGLRLTAPPSVDRAYSSPPEDELTGINNSYKFRAAAVAAQTAFHVDRKELPTKVCERKYRLGYGTLSRTIISPMFRF